MIEYGWLGIKETMTELECFEIWKKIALFGGKDMQFSLTSVLRYGNLGQTVNFELAKKLDSMYRFYNLLKGRIKG